jgi:hypothetical protein
MTKQDIVQASKQIRENHTVSNNVLEFMKNAALRVLEQLEEDSKYPDTLGVDLDHNIVCLACADEIAKGSPVPTLFWYANAPCVYPFETLCYQCNEKLDNPSALLTVDEITRTLN